MPFPWGQHSLIEIIVLEEDAWPNSTVKFFSKVELPLEEENLIGIKSLKGQQHILSLL